MRKRGVFKNTPLTVFLNLYTYDRGFVELHDQIIMMQPTMAICLIKSIITRLCHVQCQESSRKKTGFEVTDKDMTKTISVLIQEKLAFQKHFCLGTLTYQYSQCSLYVKNAPTQQRKESPEDRKNCSL